MVWIAYNQAVSDEIDLCMKECVIEGYTRFPLVHGVGKTSGPHMGTHIWPAENKMLMIVCEEEKKTLVIELVRDLRAKFKKEGIKAFGVPLEEVT